MESTVLKPSEFVALVNQTLEYAYPLVTIEGEISSFRISKNRWVYFDLKDEQATVRFFGSVYNLKQPLEDGMLVRAVGTPKLHPLYNFSVTFQTVTPSGEGSIRRAFELLKAKLEKEGLFAPERKRPLPRFPGRVGLITSSQAAAYADFLKVINARWSGVEINLADVTVQGDSAPSQITAAVDYFNQLPEVMDVLVLVRGGGSLEDLQAFNSEDVARAVAGSRTPTIVGVGHETDVSLADMAADLRASTPSNAAQLLVPDRDDIARHIQNAHSNVNRRLRYHIDQTRFDIAEHVNSLSRNLLAPARHVDNMIHSLQTGVHVRLKRAADQLEYHRRSLKSLNPKRLLSQGYSLVRSKEGRIIRAARELKVGQALMLELGSGSADAEVTDVKD